MKRSYIPWLTIIFILSLSCSNKDSESVTYDTTDATVLSFSLAAQDAYPGLGAAVFTVENRSDTGLIAPRDGDSLLYGTPLNRVVPRVTFNSRPSAAIYYTSDTSFVYTGYDTLDLTKRPVYLRVYAADRTHEKYYRIDAYAHQTDPYIYRIDTLQTQLASPRLMRVLYRMDGFHAFLTDGYSVGVTHSADAVSWTDEQVVAGLPKNTNVRQIVSDSVSSDFCYLADTSLYRSSDGVNWTATTLAFPVTPFQIEATLFSFAGRLWFAASGGGEMYLSCYDTESEQISVLQALPSDFPLSDFATVVFQSVSGRPTAFLYGGYDRDGRMSAAGWSLEDKGGEFRLINLNSSRYAQSAIAGAALVSYAGRLIRFGGLLEDGSVSGVYESETEGLTFTSSDTAHLPVPEGFAPRYRQSAVVIGSCIYLFGGQDHNQYYSDVYRTRLNSIDW